ncbi:alpha-1,2-fucosyltransferase [Thermoanaerobacterium sp. RBIITD]|uniref:alpha-1,2-fucosyltransferase n=1 Tax=Thermoanaerobacterium sp. RBIITD TaxID=1550240 RepID=UPI000BB6EE75|nr:alpha-1,2-fucosyltransferase [Thermoanaerobacterium sp. RBIITD]SNX52916.1 Glycosyl transferase family 11 [Thermoanaerobacterium sp. RBIITD]
MVIVKILGGLGNQMFQYAFYESLKSKNKHVKLDINDFKNYNLHNGYELDKIFDVDKNYCTAAEAEKLKDCSSNIISRIRRKIIGKKKTYYIEKVGYYDPDVFKKDNIYFDGYWQSERYFIDIKEIIRSKFQFKKNLDGKNIKILQKIISSDSVSIHIRRGDYVSNPEAAKKHGNICNIKYYEHAFEIIYSNISKPSFFVFSDDINWVKENLRIDNAFYIDWNKRKESYKDMYLMSRCKHNIIANSTFSWWGAWLNKNKNKIVIAPNRWFSKKDLNNNDIIPNSWLKI